MTIRVGFPTWVRGFLSEEAQNTRPYHAMRMMKTDDQRNYQAYVLCKDKVFYYERSISAPSSPFSIITGQPFNGIGQPFNGTRRDCSECRRLLGI